MLVAMDDGDRCAPIALAAHAPVAQAPGNFFLAQTFGLQQVDHFAHRVFETQAIERARVDAHAVFGGVPLLPS